MFRQSAVVGGWTTKENKVDINSHLYKLCMSLQNKIRIKYGKATPFQMFVPLTYTSQVVSGINYRVRIQISLNKQIFVTIWEQQWLNKAEVTEVVLA